MSPLAHPKGKTPSRSCNLRKGVFFSAYGQALLRTTSQSASQTAPLVGEPLAKRRSFPLCQSLPSVGATATTAASGGNREELLGPRPAGCERQRSRRWEPQPGQWHCEAMTERLSPAEAHGQAPSSYNLSVSLRSTAPLGGAPLAKPFTLRGLPKPPLGRSNSSSLFPPLAAVVAVAPSRGASGETVHFARTAKASPR